MLGQSKDGTQEIDKQRAEELRQALLRFDSSLTDAMVNSIISDLLQTVNFGDPNIAKHDLQWIAESFYKSHYLHAGWY